MTKPKIVRIVKTSTPEITRAVYDVWAVMPVWAQRRAYRQNLFSIYETAKTGANVAQTNLLVNSQGDKRHTIEINPIDAKKMTADQLHGMIAHEIAHVVFGHPGSDIDRIDCEIEADDFALSLGFDSAGAFTLIMQGN